MKKPTKSKLIKKLDKIVSLIIRSKGHSDKSGKADNLQDCHIFSRSCMSTRWDLDNHICLTAGEHLFWAHKNPIEFTEWVKGFLGLEKYEALRVKAQTIKKWSIWELEELLKGFENLLQGKSG